MKAKKKEGRKAPAGESRHGKHAGQRRQLLASPEQFREWDAIVGLVGGSWAQWARSALDDASSRVRVYGFVRRNK